MPKKKQKARTKSTAARSSRPHSRSGPSTIESQLLRQFPRWYDAHLREIAEVDDAHRHDFHASGDQILALLTLLFDVTRMLGHKHTLAAPTAPTLAALLDTTETEFGFAENLTAVIDALLHYVEFLDETDAWAASDAEFEASYELLQEVEEELDAGQPGIMQLLVSSLAEIPAVPIAEQLQALEMLKIVVGVDSLLEWIGRSHVITGTGALRLGDIEAVAGMIGINAAGRKGGRRAIPEPMLFEPEAELATGAAHLSEQLIVGTMWEISGLALWWQALVAMGVIEITSTTVRPGPRASVWRSADTAQRFSLRSDFVDRYLDAWFESEATGSGPFSPMVLIHLVAHLAAAVSPDVLPEAGTAALSHSIDEASDGLGFGAIGSSRSRLVLEQLHTAGLVRPTAAGDGTMRYLIPAGLRNIIAGSLQGLTATLMQPPQTMAPNGHPVGTTLQLTIEIEDASPQIWRRVLVDSHATLGDLHRIIQRSFLWDDSHLHRFHVDGWIAGGLTFGPIGDAASPDDELIDENLSSIGATLVDPGDELNYTYDFGDDWRHVIRLEDVVPGGTEGTPLCLAGAGLAPAENTGGPWGWADLVQVSNDPDHPDWADARDGLGLRHGEHLDPAHFNRDEVNARLARLRR
ncbi:MAG: plasmid pRiA4b ORF-3 family protein [Leifsonia sp.]